MIVTVKLWKNFHVPNLRYHLKHKEISQDYLFLFIYCLISHYCACSEIIVVFESDDCRRILLHCRPHAQIMPWFGVKHIEHVTAIIAVRILSRESNHNINTYNLIHFIQLKLYMPQLTYKYYACGRYFQ